MIGTTLPVYWNQCISNGKCTTSVVEFFIEVMQGFILASLNISKSVTFACMHPSNHQDIVGSQVSVNETDGVQVGKSTSQCYAVADVQLNVVGQCLWPMHPNIIHCLSLHIHFSDFFAFLNALFSNECNK